MKFLAVIMFCQSPIVTTCTITSREDLHPTLLECQKDVEGKVSIIAASGLFSRGYCAPVNTGMTI